MNLSEFLAFAATRRPLDTEEIGRFMDEMSDSARRITFELNGSYHTPDEVRALLSRLFGYEIDPLSLIHIFNSLINHADFSFQRLDYIQDAALGLINIEQNEIVKIFSVAAVIFMPATLVASIYGMNFHAMPELDWVYTFPDGTTVPLGYLFAIGLMILFSAGTIWFFRYKKWL